MLLFLFSCLDQNLNKLSEAENGADPIIEVSPSILSFGEYSTEPIQRNLTIANIGEEILEVNSILIQGNNPQSFINLSGIHPSTINPLELAPGESATLPFAFEPIAVQNDAFIAIGSNDPDTPHIDIPMMGSLIAPLIQVTPNPLNMGVQTLTCPSEHSIEITNTGSADLTVSGIVSDQNEMIFLSEDVLPLVLAPQSSQELLVEFTPSTLNTITGTFTVESNAMNHPYTFTAEGVGSAESHSESWNIQEGPKSDILFSVDLSSSMSDEAVTLGQQFNTFITQLSNYTSDWQVMVVNADHGCNHSGILTPNTPDYESIFAQAVRTGAYDISFTEALLTNVTRAVEKSDVGDCNEGFLRPNAQLHIIMLSDECEQSPNPGICGTQWQSYIDRINTAKGDPNLVRLSAVAGDHPNGCGGTAQFGSGYWESTLLTGGVFLSICSDWTSPMSLQLLANSSISQSRFQLAYTPIESSISVIVDGTPHQDWTLENGLEVVLQSNIPMSGSTVTIDYTEQPNCELSNGN